MTKCTGVKNRQFTYTKVYGVYINKTNIVQKYPTSKYWYNPRLYTMIYLSLAYGVRNPSLHGHIQFLYYITVPTLSLINFYTSIITYIYFLPMIICNTKPKFRTEFSYTIEQVAIHRTFSGMGITYHMLPFPPSSGPSPEALLFQGVVL